MASVLAKYPIRLPEGSHRPGGDIFEIPDRSGDDPKPGGQNLPLGILHSDLDNRWDGGVPSMKTQVKKDGDTIIVSMDGKLDYETNVPLRDNLSRIIKDAKTDSTPKKIILNLEKLEFVGSSGISGFVQTLKEFNNAAPSRPRYCNVRSEFQRVMKAFDEEEVFAFYDNEERAKRDN
jgi:anti-anti-sigma factor